MSNAFKTPAKLLLGLFMLILPPPGRYAESVCTARERLVQHGGGLAQYCRKRPLLSGKNDSPQLCHTDAFSKQWYLAFFKTLYVDDKNCCAAHIDRYG